MHMDYKDYFLSKVIINTKCRIVGRLGNEMKTMKLSYNFIHKNNEIVNSLVFKSGNEFTNISFIIMF